MGWPPAAENTELGHPGHTFAHTHFSFFLSFWILLPLYRSKLHLSQVLITLLPFQVYVSSLTCISLLRHLTRSQKDLGVELSW